MIPNEGDLVSINMARALQQQHQNIVLDLQRIWQRGTKHTPDTRTIQRLIEQYGVNRVGAAIHKMVHRSKKIKMDAAYQEAWIFSGLKEGWL